MFQADGRPHESCSGRETDLAAAHRFEGQIGLAEPGLGTLAALQRADYDRPERPGELRLPHQTRVAELGLDPEIAVAARSELAEAAVDPAFFAVDRHQAQVAAKLE